jgi:hypothetical protein
MLAMRCMSLKLIVATIVDHDGSFVIAARIALGVDGPEAFERWLTHGPELRGRGFGRVAP